MPGSAVTVVRRAYQAGPLRHRHEFRQVVFPETGRLELETATERGFVGAGRLAVIDPGVEHECVALAPATCLVVDLPLDPGEAPIASPFRRLDERLTGLHRLLQAELAAGGPHDSLAAESLAGYLRSVLQRPAETGAGRPASPAQRRLAARAREFLHSAFREHLTIERIAYETASSASHLQSSFKAATGVSIVRYVQQLRLQAARDLLRETDLSITEIALAAGFDNPAYFSRLYRREFGVPPSHGR